LNQKRLGRGRDCRIFLWLPQKSGLCSKEIAINFKFILNLAPKSGQKEEDKACFSPFLEEVYIIFEFYGYILSLNK
jgi:hypothetical protein